MKVSKYTLLFSIANTEFYLYSTLSNALIEVDEDSFLFLKNAQKSHLNITFSEVDDELYDTLIHKRFIVENDIDNFLYYKSTLTKQRAEQSYMHLTLAPTMDCCFNCHYCFEKCKRDTYMTQNTMDSIISYLNSLNSKPELRLTWFGGEPLMALSQMEQFYEKLVTGYKRPLFSNVITTGFHLNEDAIRVLQNIGVGQVQITLDGLKDTHNSIKCVSNCADTFTKVLENVDLLLKRSNINVVFRVNLTKQNAHEYVELYGYLMDRFKGFKSKGIAPAFVMDRGACGASKETNNLYFTPNEVAKFVIELYNKYQIHSPFLNYPSSFFTECAIRNVMSMSFDPEGYAYKCWEVIGNIEYAIGKLNGDGKMEHINEFILNRQLYGADPMENSTCVACKFLPICNGGCPIQRIENVFEGKNNCCCTFYKGNMEELLKIHLRLRKVGFSNKNN